MDTLKVFEAAKELELGIYWMKTDRPELGESMIRIAFDKLGAMIDLPCGLDIHDYYDYSKLPMDYMEQARRNGPVKRHPYGTVNPEYNLDSGRFIVYPIVLKCSLRHGHNWSCRPSSSDLSKIAPPKEEK